MSEFLASPTADQRRLVKIVDTAIGTWRTWDKRELGDVEFVAPQNRPAVAFRILNGSQVVALLEERKRRVDEGDPNGAARLDEFMLEHGYAWKPWSEETGQ